MMSRRWLIGQPASTAKWLWLCRVGSQTREARPKPEDLTLEERNRDDRHLEGGNGHGRSAQPADRPTDMTDVLARVVAGEAVAQGQDCARNDAGTLACPAVEKTFRWLLENGSSATDMPSFMAGFIDKLTESV